MTVFEMAAAALQMLRYFQSKDHVEVTLEFSTIYHQPELRVMHFNDELVIVKAEFYSDRHAMALEDAGDRIFGSFEDGFKRLEELIDGQK